MAIPRDELLQQRDDLQTAINSGALTIKRANGDEVTYRDLTSMRRALNQLDLQLAGGKRKYMHVIQLGSGDVPGGNPRERTW